MRSPRRLLALLCVAMAVAAGCSGSESSLASDSSGSSDSADSSGQVASTESSTESSTDDGSATSTPSSTEATTPDPESDTALGVEAFPAAPASCLELPALLDSLPKSDFIVVSEDKIFECFGVEAFASDAAFDGTMPDRVVSTVATSTQRLTSGVVSAEASFTEDGVLTEELIRIGEELWAKNDAGQWEASELGLGYFFSERGEMRLSMGGALFALSVYGGGAEPVGEVELNGRTVTRWEADAANIAAYVNSLGFAPVPVGVNDGFVTIWTTAEGLIVKLEGEIRAADVTLAGIPVDQVDPAALGLPADALDIVPDYSVSYELFDFDHDRIIEPPTVG